MNIEKVIIKVTLKGVSNQWEEGEVLFPPLPQEILQEIDLGRDTVEVVKMDEIPNNIIGLPSITTLVKTKSTLKREETRIKRVRRM